MPTLSESPAFSSFSVNDAATARSFYEDVLGLTVTEEEMSGGLRIHLGGGAEIMVYPKDDHVPATFTVLNFPVADVEATVDALAAVGVEMAKYDWVDDPKGIQREWGPAMAWFSDPAGNVFSIMQTP